RRSVWSQRLRLRRVHQLLVSGRPRPRGDHPIVMRYQVYSLICSLVFACSPPRRDDAPDATSCTEDGTCPQTCAEAAAAHGYTGCEYWPVDLHNAVEVIGAPVNGGCVGQTGSPRLAMMNVCWDGTAMHGTCDA